MAPGFTVENQLERVLLQRRLKRCEKREKVENNPHFKLPQPSRVPISLLAGCCFLFLVGCTIRGTGKPFSHAVMTPEPVSTLATTTITPAPAMTAEVQPSATNPAFASENTQVIVFHPTGVPVQTLTGSCWSVSDVLDREDAWRCMTGNEIYDPCFSIPGNSQEVICGTSPLDDRPGFKLALTEALPARGTAFLVQSAWAFKLADGTTCVFLGGATAAFEGQRVNYSCSDGWYVLGELQEGQVWTARKIRLSADLSSIKESVMVAIKVVWE